MASNPSQPVVQADLPTARRLPPTSAPGMARYFIGGSPMASFSQSRRQGEGQGRRRAAGSGRSPSQQPGRGQLLTFAQGAGKGLTPKNMTPQRTHSTGQQYRSLSGRLDQGFRPLEYGFREKAGRFGGEQRGGFFVIAKIHRERREPSQIPRGSGQADTARCHEQAELFPGCGCAERSRHARSGQPSAPFPRSAGHGSRWRPGRHPDGRARMQ